MSEVTPDAARCGVGRCYRSLISRDPERCVEHVAYSVISAGFRIGVRLFATLRLSSFAGHTLYRRLEPMTATDEPIDSELQTLPNAWTVRANLSWRIPRD